LHESFTFFSCPALAKILPSEEKWQQTTLLLLVRQQLTSLKVKPRNKRACHLMFAKAIKSMTNITFRSGQVRLCRTSFECRKNIPRISIVVG